MSNYLRCSKIGVAGIVILIVAVVILVPHLFIWSVNSLFDTAILHDLKHWFAAFVLLLLIGNTGTANKKS